MDQNRLLSGASYDVETGEIKKNQIIEDTNHLVLDVVNTDKDIIGNEQKPKGNSMQAMTTATIKKEYQSYDSKKLQKVSDYPESVITKDITIAYAGTAGWQDIKTDVREIGLNDKHSDGAFQSALEYANIIEQRYSKKDGYTISTTGHSLGGGEATYVAVLKGYNAITYGAAGAGLTDAQLKNYKGIIVNIYDTSDAVTSGLLTGGKHKVPFLSIGIDNAGWKLLGHSRDQFQLDKKGNYINKYGDIAIYSDLNGGISIEQTLLAQSIIENSMQMRRLEHYGVHKSGSEKEYQRLKKENEWLQAQIDGFTKLNVLRKKLTASGGGLSGNEQIYLDDSQALTVVQLASSKFDTAMENVVKIYKDSITELEELWQDGFSTIQSNAHDLSYGEIVEAMQSVGCTEQTMVTIPSQEFQEKLSLAQQMSSKFDALTNEITAKIEELVQLDQELASQFG